MRGTTWRSASARVGALLIGLLVATKAEAQRSTSAATGGSLRPDRPLVPSEPLPQPTPPTSGPLGLVPPVTGGCDPATVSGTCPGTFFFTYGATANARPESGGAETEKAGLAFSYYVTRRVAVELDNDNVVSSKEDTGGRMTGFGNTNLSISADALLQRGARPAVSLYYVIKIPTASSDKGLGSGEVDHTLLAVAGKSFAGGRTSLELDMGDTIAGRSSSAGYDHFPFAAGILKQALGRPLDSLGRERFRLHFEVGGDFGTEHSECDAYTLEYLETALTSALVLRTGVRIGLTSNISRFGAYVALQASGRVGR